MAIPETKHGYNFYDMLSYMQKAVRRGLYKDAAFAANEVEQMFRGAMWNRLMVISAEDCYGVLTKELLALRKLDDKEKDNCYVERAIATMCKALKSRDACYFSCNFVLVSRKPRSYEFSENEIKEVVEKAPHFPVMGDFGKAKQINLFDEPELEEETENPYELWLSLQKALNHRDMDMIGYAMDKLRNSNREFLWDVFFDYATNYSEADILEEIKALKETDEIVNRNKKNKDEIFISKAAMVLCYSNDASLGDVRASEMIDLTSLIDWTKYRILSLERCFEQDKEIPEWVFDCHTLKGKRMRKTDWDMTTAEQEALTPKKLAYFDEASWLYTYEDDFITGRESKEHMIPIWEYAKSHEVNPVKLIPYEE